MQRAARVVVRHPLVVSVALMLACMAMPVAARVSSMPVDPACVEPDCADTVETNPAEAQKAVGSEKRTAPPAARAVKPGNTRASAARKPRWHRYLPGMYR